METAPITALEEKHQTAISSLSDRDIGAFSNNTFSVSQFCKGIDRNQQRSESPARPV